MFVATVTDITSSAEARQAAQTQHLAEMILFARIEPGRKLTKAEFARLASLHPEQISRCLPALVESGLVIVEDAGDIIVAPLRKGVLHADIPHRRSLETFIAMVAARRATDEQCKRLMELQAMVRQASFVGDVEACTQADVELEMVLGTASGLASAAEELRLIKAEFRRAWCSVHRFRNCEDAADFRLQLVEAIAAHDPAAAKQAIDDFYTFLLAAY